MAEFKKEYIKYALLLTCIMDYKPPNKACVNADAFSHTGKTDSFGLLLKRPGTSLYTMSCKVLSDLWRGREMPTKSVRILMYSVEEQDKYCFHNYTIHPACHNLWKYHIKWCISQLNQSDNPAARWKK